MGGLECYICNEEGRGDGGRERGLCALTNCGHVFHTHCIITWRNTSQKKTCPVCRKPSDTLLTLFGSNTEEGAEGAAAPAEQGLTETEHELLYQSHKDDFEKLLEKYRVTLEDIHISTCNYAILQQNLEKAEIGLNESRFKISMFEEMFGTEVSKQFDALIAQAKK